MNVFGAIVTFLGFLGGTYENYLAQSYSYFGSSSAKFNSAVLQNVSGVIGFVAVILGFIEVSISYLPYQSPINDITLALWLIITNFIIAAILLAIRTYLIGFYKGLWAINFHYKNIIEIQNEYVHNYMSLNHMDVQNAAHISKLKSKAWKNWRLLINVSRIKI